MIASLSTESLPEQRLADHVVEREDLHPPVAIRKVVEKYADVREVWLPTAADVDAIVHGLHTIGRPTVIINSNRPPTRMLFTYAHELGHILLPWHLGTIPCHVADTPPTHAGDAGNSAAVIARQEGEAHRFASRVLLPRRYLTTVISLPVPQMLRAIEASGISPEAGLIGLVNALPPGYLFVLLRYGNVIDNWFASHGTLSFGVHRYAELDESYVSAAAEQSDRARLYGRWVWWARYPERLELREPTADWRTILNAILTDTHPDQDARDTAWKSISGVVGAANTRAQTTDPARIAALITQRFADRPDLVKVRDHPRFDEFLAARALAIAEARRRRS